MKIVFISDTHDQIMKHPIPEGDVLVHCGDICGPNSVLTVKRFNIWIGALPHLHKIVIAGNHDFIFEKDNKNTRSLLTNVIYLQDTSAIIDNVNFYGSPWQPWFYDWAFNFPKNTRKEAVEIWSRIPDTTDILITHTPPYGVLDKTLMGQAQAGCKDLLKRINKIQTKINVFGHIHEAYGTKKTGDILFINASICDYHYRPVNKPVVVDYNNGQVVDVSNSLLAKNDKTCLADCITPIFT